MSGITWGPGKKHKEDRIYYWYGHQPTFQEYIALGVALVINEDNVYKKEMGFEGGDKLIRCITACLDAREVTKEILEDHMLKFKHITIRREGEPQESFKDKIKKLAERVVARTEQAKIGTTGKAKIQ